MDSRDLQKMTATVKQYKRPDPHDPKRNRVSISQWEDAISIKDPRLADIQRAVNDFCTMFPDIKVKVAWNRPQHMMTNVDASYIELVVYYKGKEIGNMKRGIQEHDFQRMNGRDDFERLFAQDFIRQLLMRGIKSVFDEMYEEFKEEQQKAELDADIFDF